MATSKAMPTQHVSSAAAATPTQHVSSAAAASETEFSIRSELEHVGPARSRLHSKKSKMQHPWHVQQQQMSHLPEDDDFEVTPGGASPSSAGVVFGGGPLVPPLPRFGTAAKATQAFLAREQSPAAAASVVGESADLWANFRARQREASSVRRPSSPDHPPPPNRPAPVPPTAPASLPPPADAPPPAPAQHLSRITDTDDRVHDVPQGHDPILRLGLAC